jgi:TRAP transporter 4TM/12TM fusion protein
MRTHVMNALAVLILLVSLSWALQLPSRLFGMALHIAQPLALVLGAALALTFLSRPVTGTNRAALWRTLDALLALLSLAVFGYFAWAYQTMLNDLPFRPTYLVIASGAAVLMVLEGMRRAAGWTLTLIVAGAIGYGMIGHLVEGALTTRRVSLERMTVYLGMDTSALLGSALGVGVTVVVFYIIFGRLLFAAGGGEFFTDLATSGVGRRRGGAAKSAVVGSALFGTISGSAVANVTSTGVVTIPLMVKSGFTPLRAGAIEAVASTGGQIMPPIMGAAAFLVAETLRIPFSTVLIAATVPALLYYVSLFMFIDLAAARDGIRPIDVAEESPWSYLRRGLHFLLPFAVLFIALFVFRQSAAMAAIWSIIVLTAVCMVIPYADQRLTPGGLWQALVETGLSVAPLLLILAGAGLPIGVLNLTGLGFALTLMLLDFAQGNLLILLGVSALACIVLGMGMPTTGVYLLLSSLVAPALVEAGVLPLSAHLFILYFGLLSMITPPIAIAAFAAANISGARPMATGLEAMKAGWIAYVLPFIFVLTPELILEGSPGEIATVIAITFLGTWILTVASIGWWRHRLVGPVRLVVGLCGVIMVLPLQLAPLQTIVLAVSAAATAALCLHWVPGRESGN